MKFQFLHEPAFKFGCLGVLTVFFFSLAAYSIGYEQGRGKGLLYGRKRGESWFINSPFESLDEKWGAIETMDSLSKMAETHMDEEHKRLSRKVFGDDADLGVATLKCWLELTKTAEFERNRISVGSP